MDAGEELRDTILELLSNAPSSFAALYGYVVRAGWPSVPVGAALVVLEEFEAQGWVRVVRVTGDGRHRAATSSDRADAAAAYQAWLGGLPRSSMTAEGLSTDEVGLWFEITPSGFEASKKRAGEDQGDPPWALDDDAQEHVINIYAEDLEIANRALLDWLEEHHGMAVVAGTRCVEPVAEYHLRNGSRIRDGIRLRVAYDRAPSR